MAEFEKKIVFVVCIRFQGVRDVQPQILHVDSERGGIIQSVLVCSGGCSTNKRHISLIPGDEFLRNTKWLNKICGQREIA